MRLHIPFEYLKHTLWPKKGFENQSVNLTPNHKKIGIHLDLLVCRWRATYLWKNLDEEQNFASNFTSIGGLHKKLWASKIAGIPISKISGLPSWESWDRMTFGCNPRG
jgi:hypothetical protein